MLTFKTISLAMTALTIVLAILLGFAPQIIFWIFGLDGNEVADFISRRAAFVFLGLGVISWMGRDAVHSQLRQAICIGMMVMMGGLAGLGFGEFARGFAGIGILGAAITEALFAMGYIKIWQQNAAD